MLICSLCNKSKHRTRGERASNTSSPAPSRTLYPLDNTASPFFDGEVAAGSPESFDNGHETGRRHQPGMSLEAGDDGDPCLQQNHRQAEWPVFGRVERQRANDERRSQTRSHQSNYSRNKNHTITNVLTDSVLGPHSVSQQSRGSPPYMVRRRDPLLQHQQQSTNVQEEVRRTAKRNNHERQNGTTERVRPRSGSAAGKDSGCDFGRDSTTPLKLSRKRPASADIMRERDRGVPVRIRLEQDKDAPGATDGPELVELTWKKQQQLPRERGDSVGRAPNENPRRTSGLGVVAATVAGGGRQQQRRPPDSSQRPKSAYPRLEEGGRLDSRLDGMDNEGTGKRSSRVSRMRSLSAQALRRSASASYPATTTPREIGRDGRVHHRPTEAGDGGELAITKEEEEDEHEGWGGMESGKIARVEVVGNKSTMPEGRSNVMMATRPATTTTTKICSGRTHADNVKPAPNAYPGRGVGQSDGQKYHVMPAAGSAAENDRSPRRQSSTMVRAVAPQATTTHLTTDSNVQVAAGTRTRKATNSRRVVARSPPSRSRKGGSPRVRRQRRPNVVARVDARADNGRDGKFYLLDLDSDEKQRQNSVHLDSASCNNNNDPCLDNGRDGKLYVELDNGRDGKCYLEVELDNDEESHGKLVASAPLEVATGYNDKVRNVSGTWAGKLEQHVVSTADESLEHTKAGKSSQPERRAEAAKIIQQAMARAVIRRRSNGDGGGEGGRGGKAMPEKHLLDVAKDDFRPLAEREGDGAQRNPERVSMLGVAAGPLEVRGD